MLNVKIPRYYKVRAGQTLRSLSEAYSIPETRIVQDNDLQGEIEEGQILRLPSETGNLYVVRAGDTKEFLCGSVENYRRKNGTNTFYPGMKIWI